MAARGGWVGLAVLGLALSGCALADVRLKPPPSGLETPVPGGRGRQVVVAGPFADAREIRNRCGMQKGGYGNETADAICQGDPGEWIATLLARELAASGFEVVPAEAGTRAGALRVEGLLLKIFAEPVVGLWTTTVETDLSVKLVATSRTGLRAERTFFAKGEMESLIWPQGIFNDSAARGIRDLLSKMVGAILELMNRYPDLGLERQHPPRLLGRAPEPGR